MANPKQKYRFDGVLYFGTAQTWHIEDIHHQYLTNIAPMRSSSPLAIGAIWMRVFPVPRIQDCKACVAPDPPLRPHEGALKIRETTFCKG